MRLRKNGARVVGNGSAYSMREGGWAVTGVGMLSRINREGGGEDDIKMVGGEKLVCVGCTYIILFRIGCLSFNFISYLSLTIFLISPSFFFLSLACSETWRLIRHMSVGLYLHESR